MRLPGLASAAAGMVNFWLLMDRLPEAQGVALGS
jgi:hypothetical protein